MMEMIFFLLIVGCFSTMIVVEINMLRHWKKAWRWLATLPGLVLLAVILNILIGTLHDRTAHNLWPLEIFIWSSAGLIFLGLLQFLHKLSKA